MENKKNSIEDLYKKAFDEFTVTPSTHAWDKIEKTLQKPSFLLRHKTKISILAILLIAGGVGIAYLFNQAPTPVSSKEQSLYKQNVKEKLHLTPSIPENQNPYQSTNNEPVVTQVKKNQTEDRVGSSFIELTEPIQTTATLQKTTPFLLDQEKTEGIHIIEKAQESNIKKNSEPNIQYTNISEDSLHKGTVAEDKGEWHSYSIDEDIIMPNAFTPNEIENTVFKPISHCSDCILIEMTIYAKSGELIYRTKEVNLGWNGSIKGNTAKKGTFVYRIYYKKNGTESIKNGFVIVL